MSQATTGARANASTVYEQIRSKILRNEITPGSRINIDGIARELGVSPTPVREALQHLQGDNLVLKEEGRGYSATPLLNALELRKLFEFRLLIEPWAARVAAGDRLSNPGHILERQLAELQNLIDSQGDVRFNLVEHDTAFHDAIIVAAENDVVHNAYTQAHCHLHAFRLHPADHSGSNTVPEHRAIAEAIRNRDPQAAEQAMREHLINAYLRFAEGHTQNIGLPGFGESRPAQNTRLAI